MHQPPRPSETESEAIFERMSANLDTAQEAVESAALLEGAGRQPLRVSIVIPVYNERNTVCELVRRVQAAGIHHEIIVVDDGSTDGTREVLKTLGRLPDVRVILHEVNQGKGAALRTGFANATGDVVLIQDADLEYDPSDYRQLLAPLEAGKAEVVYGSRFLMNAEQDPSRVHRFGNWALTAASNLFTGQQLTDMETCYKVFRRSLLDEFEMRQDRFGFEPEFTAKLARRGVEIVEVPIHYNSRDYAEGKKIGVSDGINALWCIARYGLGD